MSKKTPIFTWVIQIGGYGSFLFEGNELEAEEMRIHKANWEQGIGWKRIATKEEVDSKSSGVIVYSDNVLTPSKRISARYSAGRADGSGYKKGALAYVFTIFQIGECIYIRKKDSDKLFFRYNNISHFLNSWTAIIFVGNPVYIKDPALS